MLGLVTALRNARLDAITTFAGASPIIRLYDGTRPATGGAATTVLSDHACSATMAPAAAGGVLTFNAIGSDASANASSTVSWFRLFKSDGTTIVLDGAAGADVITTQTGTASTDTITVGSATGIVIGQYVSGTGIASGSTVVDIQGTAIHLSKELTGAASGNATFFWDLRVTPAAVTAGQVVNITALTITDGNA